MLTLGGHDGKTFITFSIKSLTEEEKIAAIIRILSAYCLFKVHRI